MAVMIILTAPSAWDVVGSVAANDSLSMQAPSRQVMQYWLQQLQQKRWEFSNTRGCGNRDSLCSPTPLFPHTGLVARDAGKSLSRVGRLYILFTANNPYTHTLYDSMWNCSSFLVLLNSVPHCQDVLLQDVGKVSGCCSAHYCCTGCRQHEKWLICACIKWLNI